MITCPHCFAAIEQGRFETQTDALEKHEIDEHDEPETYMPPWPAWDAA